VNFVVNILVFPAIGGSSYGTIRLSGSARADIAVSNV